MATSRGVDLGGRRIIKKKSWRKGRTSARPSHLTTADVLNKVSPKESPSKTAKARFFEGCRPWIETQQMN